jgi:hypothetical protein
VIEDSLLVAALCSTARFPGCELEESHMNYEGPGHDLLVHCDARCAMLGVGVKSQDVISATLIS